MSYPNPTFRLLCVVLTRPDQVILGAIIGCFLGFGFRYLMKFCQKHDLIDRHSYVAQYVSLAMLTIGVTTLLGSDDLLAAFFCGTAFAWDGFFNRQTEESVFSSVIDLLFNIAAFVYVGAWMPFNKFQDLSLTLEVWRLFVIAILILLLRRLPVMVALYKWIPDIKTFREAVFAGHFGPIGIGAVFISTLAMEVLHRAQEAAHAGGSADAAPGIGDESTAHLGQTELLMQTIEPIVAFMVLCSITIHGLSIPSFSLGRRVHSVSRTWSRRDTMQSANGTRTPEWANQATIVRRGDEIVINRDRDEIVGGHLNGHYHGGRREVDLEKGDSYDEKMDIEESEGDRRVSQRKGTASTAGSSSEETKMNLSDTLVLPPRPSTLGGYETESPLDLQDPSGGIPTSVDRLRPQLTPMPSKIISSSSHTSSVSTPTHADTKAHDYREEQPPDGTETINEWMEGSHRVVERRLGPGDDVSIAFLSCLSQR